MFEVVTAIILLACVFGGMAWLVHWAKRYGP
ncbi:hypothetical protein LCGC14_0363890 [marine sediment metagenome]|uniref:Uncharacterized protein n=1 Tax=marine sediment metagenome TaxID=412755 RepID=A0A0F9T736_9ZZZZ